MINFQFSNDYILENEAVRLSPLNMTHLEGLLEISKEADLWTYFLEKGNGVENLTLYLENAVANRKAGKEYPFVVFDKISNQYAGSTRLYEFSSDFKTIKLGHTWYGKDFRGTGLNKHCKYLLFEFVFEQLDMERIGFGSYLENKRSVAAMESVGCQREGILRNIFPALDGEGRADGIVLSILNAEWSSKVKAELKEKLLY